MWRINLKPFISVSRHIKKSFGQCHQFFYFYNTSVRKRQATKCFHTRHSDIYSFSIREIINYAHANGVEAQRNKVNWICNQAVWIMRLNDSQMKDWKWFDIWFGLDISTAGQTPIQLTPAWFERERETHAHQGGYNTLAKKKKKTGKSSQL